MSQKSKVGAPGDARLGISDGALLGLIADTRARLSEPQVADQASLREALARLEQEAARRGLNLPDVEQPEPPRSRLELFREAVRENETLRQWRIAAEMSAEELYVAYREARETLGPETQLAVLTVLCGVLDSGVYGVATALRRHLRYALVDGSLEDRLRRVNEALSFTFGIMAAQFQLGQHRGED